ncbi:MAG TPA: nucleotidyltransferase domain-containing protein [Acidimicrobiales bacterium]|nr:nucleotidyltransferase domain-containing protein [Acidimicrobiales bacterium]
MDLARPLTVVSPTVDADVLAVLAGAEAEFTGRQVHQIAGRHSEKGVRNSLHRLVGQGVANARRAGSADLYSLNRQHLAAPYIMGLAGLRHELLARLGAELAGWQEAPIFAALFGSAASGRMRPDSDIDLLVVRPKDVDVEGAEWRRQLENLSTEVTAWTGNDTRVLELDEDEVRRGLQGGERVLADARDECVVLYGEAAYLRAGPRSMRAGRG